MKSEFIIAITKDRKLGEILAPYLIRKVKGGNFYTIEERLMADSLYENRISFTEDKKKLINLIEEYSPQNLKKRFSKDLPNVQEFYNTITKEKLEKFIIPYIERRNSKCIDILANLVNSGTPIKLFNAVNKQNLHLNDEIEIMTEPAITVFNFEKTVEEIQYFLTIRHNKNEISLKNKHFIIISNNPCRLLLEHKLYFFNDIDGKKLLPFFTKEYIVIPKNIEKKYCETFILKSIENYSVKTKNIDILEIMPEVKPVLYLESDLMCRPVLSMQFNYDEHKFYVNEDLDIKVFFKIEDGRYTFYKLFRNSKREKELISLLLDNGLMNTNGSNFIASVSNPETDKNEQLWNILSWLNNHSWLLSENRFEIIQNHFKSKYFINEIIIRPKVISGQDWFDIYTNIFFRDYCIPFLNLRDHILNGIREYILPDGQIAVIPQEWFAKYKELLLLGKIIDGKLKLKKHYFQVIKDINGEDSKYLPELMKILKPDSNPVVLPETMKTRLRLYQKIGYFWLKHLQMNGFGGILSDDMGLGKTIQTLAILVNSYQNSFIKSALPVKKNLVVQLSLFDQPEFIQHKSDDDVAIAASLVVVPTSLVHNWENEIRRFAPELKYYKYCGTERFRNITIFDNYHIILSTYGIVRNDIDILKKYSFYYIILDESQYIKNPDSIIYQSVIELNATHRLVLTGTPIENSLSDLWSQINFVNRGILGNLAFFKEKFVTPVEKQNNQEVRNSLQKIIQPFILRRKKEEVEQQLPPLTEQVIYCQMSESQNKFYIASYFLSSCNVNARI
ncbi:MAG: hypothetical protein HY738_16130 [Bacteroidia bacterium]|nr:hypothetical protein [Bacteroidia bacterium]